MFNNQVENLRAAGVSRIQTAAIREGVNGYYTWARLGYDGEFSGSIRRQLQNPRRAPASLSKMTRVSELMRSAEGRNWWRENGESLDLEFDLDPDSTSSRVLAEYMQKRGT